MLVSQALRLAHANTTATQFRGRFPGIRDRPAPALWVLALLLISVIPGRRHTSLPCHGVLLAVKRRWVPTATQIQRSEAPRIVAKMIRLIAAMDATRGIATAAGIPWKLPGDTAYFREKTARGLILMGRATYDEFEVPLHGRDNFVLSAGSDSLRTGFRRVGSLDQLHTDHPGEDVWVIGGAGVYAETISEADELLITQVLGDFKCTKFFPAFTDDFRLASRGDDRQDGGITYRFETWQRR
jgi:dihydrofolate reductase